MTKTTKPTHAPMDQFPVVDNVLQIGGRSITELAEELGHTPFYLYDRQLINQRVDQLRQALPARIQLHYAMKANPLPELVQHLNHLTDGIDVASAGELKVALTAGAEPTNISFAGPGKTNSELQFAIESRVIICMESAGEMQRIHTLAQKIGKKARVAIRVNPNFELKGSGMTMGGGAKPFGIDAEKIPDLLANFPSEHLDLQGFHIYWGSQNLNPEAIIEAHNNTFALARKLAQFAPTPIQWLNIGGGFGIPYFPGEKRLLLDEISHNLAILLEQYTEFSETEIVIELGRYLVGEAGVYVCEIIDRKESRGETFLITNGGMHHHLALSGNLGQVIRKNYPVCIGNKMSSAETEIVSVAGPLCTPLDILANKMELPKAEPGDLLVVYQSGAYGYTASPQRFLGHPEAIERLI